MRFHETSNFITWHFTSESSFSEYEYITFFADIKGTG